MSVALESLRLVRSRRPLVAAGALALFLVLMLVGFYTYAQSRTGGAAEFRATFENRSYFNGLTFALYAFYFGFVLLLPIFAATEGGAQLAGDTGAGTLALFLTRPVSKVRLYFTRSSSRRRTRRWSRGCFSRRRSHSGSCWSAGVRCGSIRACCR